MPGRKLKYALVGCSVVLLLSLAMGVFAQALAAAQPAGIAGEERLIVTFDKTVSSDIEKDDVLRQAGGRKLKDLSLINGAVVQAPTGMAGALSLDRRIVRVERDEIVHVDAQSMPWGIGRIKSDKVWDGDGDGHVDVGANAGQGVKVAVIDTGIDLSHPDLAANIKGGASFVSGAPTPNDYNGHGTHVAGTIAALDNSEGVIGVAPKASLYAVKVLDNTGSGYISDIISGLQWSVANNMQVVNMSFGGGGDVQAMHDAIIAASRAGIVLVAAAGNSGNRLGTGDNVSYPARYPEVIAVAAVNSSDVRADFSSTGNAVELAAPGVSILSSTFGGGYGTKSGTSMASPHVAGAAALAIASGITDRNGNGLISDEVRVALVSTATNLGVAGRDTSYGYGLVNVESAIANGGAPPAAAPAVATLSPSPVTRDTATLNGSLTSLGSAGSVNVSFLWGTTLATSNETSVAARNAAGNFSAEITGLTPGTAYYFKAKAAGDGTAYGAVRSFVYRPLAPVVQTRSSTAMLRDGATLNGYLVNTGSATTVNVSFLWGTTASTPNQTPEAAQTSPGPFTFDLTGLTPGVRYYIRAKAVGDGTAYGSVTSFRFSLRRPYLSTRTALAARDSATLNGYLGSLGSATSTAVWFRWGATTALTEQTVPESRTSTGLFSQEVTGLTPGVRYYFKAVAEGDGTNAGAMYSFIYRLASPRITSYSPQGSATFITATSATLNGTLLSKGTAVTVAVSFVWGTTYALSDGETTPVSMDATGGIAAGIDGLLPKTRYYYRAKAAGDGVRLGELRSFVTPAA